MPRLTNKLRLAHKANASQLAEHVAPTVQVANETIYSMAVVEALSLTPTDRKHIFDLVEKNMRDCYQKSSLGWNSPAKKKELFHKLSRFILVRPLAGASDAPLAFAMFRFEREEGEDILYCYELQISRAAQRCGLGTILMQQLFPIGRRWGMEKIMLTVLRANVPAVKFYDSFGFTLDPASPHYRPSDDEEWVDEDEEDYEIRSKNIE